MILPSIVDSNFENKIFEASHNEYHSIKDAVHSSSLKNMLTSPHAYKYFLEHPAEQTKSMKFGTLAHEALLEGSSFLANYVVQPIFVGYTKDGKETTSMAASDVKRQYTEWISQLPRNAQIMTQSEYDRLRWMMDSLLNHKFVQDVLKDGLPEHKMMWRDPVSGFKCVCSHDFVSYKNDIWVDVKTTTSPKWVDFRRNGVEKYRYDLQAAFYEKGIEAVHGKKLGDRVWIAIQSEPPWQVFVHYVDPYYMESGGLSMRNALRDLKTSIKNNSWPQAQVMVEAGEPSPWFKQEFDGPLLEEQQ